MTNKSIPTINHFVALVRLKNLSDDIKYIEKIAQEFVSLLHLNVIGEARHKFSPQGATLLYMLSESHMAVHTWPESGYVHIDLVTCSYSKKEFEKSLNSAFADQHVESVVIKKVDLEKL